MGHNCKNQGSENQKSQKQPNNGSKTAILAIIYWIPRSVGTTVQKGLQTDAYVAQHNKNSVKRATKKVPKCPKMAIFPKMANAVTELTILDWLPWSIGATVKKSPSTNGHMGQNCKNRAQITKKQKQPKKWL